MGLFDYFKKDKSTKKEDMQKQIATNYSKWQSEIYGLFSKVDETAETALEMLAMKVAKKIGVYQHSDEKIKELVERNIEKIQGSLSFVVKDLVEESFMKGFAGAEIVWEIVGNELRTKKIIVLDSSECDYSFTTEDFKFNGVLIPKEKLIFYNRKKAKAKKINKLLDVKELLFQMWCQYIEGFITPVMHGKTDNDVEKLNEKLKDIFFKTSIVTDKDTDILTIKLDSGGSAEIQSAMEYIDKLIYRVFFLGGNFSQGEKSGTTANAGVNETILEDVTDWLAEEVREALLENWIRKIIQYNVGEIDDYGAFENPTNRDTEMLARLATALKTIADMGVITINDFDKIREMFGFEKLEEDVNIDEKNVDNSIEELITNDENN